MKTLYIEPDCGVAGDMLVAALMQLEGAPAIKELRSSLESLPVTEKWNIAMDRVLRHSISAGLFKVEVDSGHSHEHDYHHGRSLKAINEIISKADKLSNQVKEQASAVFAKLAVAEARVHGKDMQSVHFHEVGAVDAIIDIVSCCLIIETLKVDRIISSPVALGKGSIKSAHGVLPVPVPATVNLLEGIPVNHIGIPSELATPTGSALLATLVDEWQVSPAGLLSTSGYGGGTRDLKERAAVIRVSIYEGDETSSYPSDRVGVIECNFDDMPGEAFSWIASKLLEMGALDYFMLPTQMKKNRPGIMLQLLCLPEEIAKFADFLLKETTTLGIRFRIDDRMKLNREIIKIETPWGETIVKTASDGLGKRLKSKVEYESCAKLASENNLSFLEMQQKLNTFLLDK